MYWKDFDPADLIAAISVCIFRKLNTQELKGCMNLRKSQLINKNMKGKNLGMFQTFYRLKIF